MMKRVSNYSLSSGHFCPNAKSALQTILYSKLSNIYNLDFLYFTVIDNDKAIFEVEYFVRGEKKRLAGNLKVNLKLDKHGTIHPTMDVEFEEFRYVEGMNW